MPVLARWHVSPNAVSLVGLLFGLLAGFAYYHYRSRPWDVAGFVAMILWHVMDGADGQLARLTQSQSHFGKILDGISDALTFAAVYTALTLALVHEHDASIIALVIVAAMCHAIQAASYEALRQEYDVLAWGRMKPQPVRPIAGVAGVGPRLLGFVDRVYFVGLSFPAARAMRCIRTAMYEARERRPDHDDAIRERYRVVFAPLLRRWSILSANYHTLGIFLCASFAAPKDYFWFTIIGFNVILIWLVYQLARGCAKFTVELEATGAAGA